MSLNQLIENFLRERGAIAVGFSTPETLAGGPPSTDLTYRLASARSAVSFALPLNRDRIRAFLAKEDRLGHEEDNIGLNLRVTNLSWELAEMLRREGHEAMGVAANTKYRKEFQGWQMLMHPDISHRYLAAASGVGSFGWSGNIGVKGVGTSIILGSTVTNADLTPTAPVPEGESFCENCRLCATACAGEMMDRETATSLTLGGRTFSFSARKSILLCQLVCGGFTGLSRSGKWSTWSPGRFEIPDYRDPKNLLTALLRAMQAYGRRPPMPGGYSHPAAPDARQYLTCGNCQIVCFGNRAETAANVKLLHGSGCMLQRPDGSLYRRPADEARTEFDGMEPERKSLYSCPAGWLLPDLRHDGKKETIRVRPGGFAPTGPLTGNLPRPLQDVQLQLRFLSIGPDDRLHVRPRGVCAH